MQGFIHANGGSHNQPCHHCKQFRNTISGFAMHASLCFITDVFDLILSIISPTNCEKPADKWLLDSFQQWPLRGFRKYPNTRQLPKMAWKSSKNDFIIELSKLIQEVWQNIGYDLSCSLCWELIDYRIHFCIWEPFHKCRNAPQSSWWWWLWWWWWWWQW